MPSLSGASRPIAEFAPPASSKAWSRARTKELPLGLHDPLDGSIGATDRDPSRRLLLRHRFTSRRSGAEHPKDLGVPSERLSGPVW